MQDSNNGFATNNARPQRDVDINFIVAKVLGNWYWYVASVGLLLIAGILIAVFTSPRYTVKGRVLVTGYNSQGKAVTGTDESTILKELGMFSVPNSVSNELEIIHSRTLVEKTVRDLQLNVTYWGQGDIRYEEIYKNSPYFIKLLSLKNITDPIEYDVRVDGDTLKFEDENSDTSFKASFGDTLYLNYGSWVLVRNNYVTEANPKHQLGVVINSYNASIYAYMDAIEAMTTNDYVNIIDLSISGPTPERNEDMLKHLISLYIQADVNDQNRIADSTITFIDARLARVSRELSGIDKNIESFKKRNKLTDLTNDAQQVLQNNNTVTQSLADKEVQLQVVSDLEAYLQDEHNNTRVMPTTAPIKDPAFVETLDKYNSLQLQRQTQLQTSTEVNPNVKSLDIQLRQLRGDLLNMMRTYKQGISTEQKDLQSRSMEVTGLLEKVPTQQRMFLDFTRRQNVVQSLYLYLLQTREQTAVSKSNNIAPIRVIDEPIRGPLPYFPNMILIIAVAVFLGILIPSVIIFMRELLNTRIRSADDISNLTDVPLLAKINHNRSARHTLVFKDPGNEIAEQFRAMRTNLLFRLPETSEKVIVTSSSMENEGKTFIAVNLACSLAASGRKVLLMEMDLRNPSIYSILKIGNSIGFSDYILSDIRPTDIIRPSGIYPDLYFISPGLLSSNPADLLTRNKVQQLFNELRKEFEFIIVDCSPVGIVTDALVLSRYTDLLLYVVRQRITYKKQVNIIQALANEKRFKKIDVVFNDIKPIPGYGYGYTNKLKYGHYKQNVAFYKKIPGIGKVIEKLTK